MRVISGSLGGRQIEVPKNFRGRPTTDFAREGLFNLIGHKMNLEGAHVLDLFAGTGAFSIECFSRGAANADAIDISPIHVKFIQQNFDHFNLPGMAFKNDVFRFLPTARQSYDLIFADPPHDLKKIETLPGLILGKPILKEGGMLIIEHGTADLFEGNPCLLEERKYGNVYFSFFRNLPL